MMRQLKPLLRNAVWVVSLALLGLGLIFMLRSTRPSQTAQAPESTPAPLLEGTPAVVSTPPLRTNPFDSPIQTPTTRFPGAPDEIPSPLPPVTPPPFTPEPTHTPSPTFTPAPPTPTPQPLPTLIPGLDTLVYATTADEGYPELYRVQVNRANQTVRSAHLISTADLWYWPFLVSEFYPSPDGTKIAVQWYQGGSGAVVSILRVADGRFTPLFGEYTPMFDPRVNFLDWSPDGRHVLVQGLEGNIDLGDRLWLVEIETGAYHPIDIKETQVRSISSAAFSPDEKSIVYAYRPCGDCKSRVSLIPFPQDGSSPRVIFEAPEAKIYLY